MFPAKTVGCGQRAPTGRAAKRYARLDVAIALLGEAERTGTTLEHRSMVPFPANSRCRGAKNVDFKEKLVVVSD